MYEAVCVALLAGMLTINAANIVSRGIFDHALNWVWPWTMVAFLWWVMLALFPLYNRRKDVSIYILQGFLPRSAQRLLGVFVHLAIMLAMGILIYTFPERLASSRGNVEIVNLPRQVLVWPLLISTVPVFVGALVSLIKIILKRDAYVPFGMIEVQE
tara:strand:- start:45998 stop:46468 length:471 start_codon:yes stop_codon:yes gene_type:complete